MCIAVSHCICGHLLQKQIRNPYNPPGKLDTKAASAQRGSGGCGDIGWILLVATHVPRGPGEHRPSDLASEDPLGTQPESRNTQRCLPLESQLSLPSRGNGNLGKLRPADLWGSTPPPPSLTKTESDLPKATKLGSSKTLMRTQIIQTSF